MLWFINSKTATSTGVEMITRANTRFGVVISGKIALPYFVTPARLHHQMNPPLVLPHTLNPPSVLHTLLHVY
jgi:hypothetical protein